MIFNIGSGSSNKLPVLDTSYPLDENVDVGETASFEVKIAEPGKPAEYTYQWYYDGSAVEGATGITYSRVAEVGEHSVYCMVTNKAGVVKSRTATISADALYLYKLGDLCEDVTGGWTKISDGSVSNSASGLVVTVPKSYKAGGAKMVNQIDLTNYNYVVSEITGNTEMPLTIRQNNVDVASGNGTIDISTISGLCEFRFYVESSGSTGRTVTVTSMRLKK
jgi:hypothetical protein